MKRVLYIPVFIIIFLCAPSALSTTMLRGINKVDLIKIDAHVRDNVINVSFFYINRAEDKLVIWDRGSISCKWVVWCLEGDIFDEKKGVRIKKGFKTLRRSDQYLYINVPSRYARADKRGLIECKFKVNRLNLTASDKFYFKL